MAARARAPDDRALQKVGRAPQNKGMKLTKLSAAWVPVWTCRLMPAPVNFGRGHRFAAYPRCSAGLEGHRMRRWPEASMKVARRVLGVIVGYAIFAVSAVLLFQLTRRNPHAEQPTMFMAGSVIYGIMFAIAGGYVSAVLGGGSARVQAGAVGVAIALGATVSLLAGPSASSAWSRVAALLLMAPAAAIGGIIRARLTTNEGRTPR